MKKAIKIILLGLLAFIVISVAYMWSLFGDIIQGANSVEKLTDTMYYMEYKGDDGFEGLMKQGGCENIKQLAAYTTEFLSKGYVKTAEINPPLMDVGCSTLTVKTPQGGVMMGRNFDYPYGTAMILHTIPDEGYESISTFSLEFLGFGDDYKPEGFQNQYMALASLFLALDGVNEKGFAIAVLEAGDDVKTDQLTSKPDLTTTSAIRYLLRKAANVTEAIDLLNSIDMHSDPGAAYHLAMSDATGKSVVVEYVDNQMVITETPSVTNHYLCEAKHNVGLGENDHRYDSLMEQYGNANGVMDAQGLTDAITSVAQQGKNPVVGGTQWTMVMDLTHPSATYYSHRNFDKPFHFELSKSK